MTCEVLQKHGHFEIFINGNFYCTVDSYPEAETEIKNYIGEHKNDK